MKIFFFQKDHPKNTYLARMTWRRTQCRRVRWGRLRRNHRQTDIQRFRNLWRTYEQNFFFILDTFSNVKVIIN